jgi:hypothetical protein
VSGEDEVYVFGSQAILGQYPDAPDSLRQSAEADIALVKAELADVIDDYLGELSLFHGTHGFYVHGVSVETAVLPDGWQERAVAVRNDNTSNNTGWCLEAHDLAVSKLVAFRDKDKNFVRTLLVEKLIDPKILDQRLRQLPKHRRVTPELVKVIEGWIGGTLRDIRSRADLRGR